MNRAMNRKLTMLVVTGLLSLFALEGNDTTRPVQDAPLSGVATVISIDDSQRTSHP